MYSALSESDYNYNVNLDTFDINEADVGNDFEKIISIKQPQFSSLMKYLNNLEGSIFSRLTGSGSCIFSAFEEKSFAEKAKLKISRDYKELWVKIVENNLINLF